MNVTSSFLISVLLLSPAVQAEPDVLTSDEIAESLQNEKPKTRGIPRGFSVRVKAKVDLDIPFEHNSSTLAPEAEEQLTQLSEALSRESLADFRFEVAGHTDASGSAEYNRQLSEKRAKTVLRYLVDAGVDRNRLKATGYGEDELLRRDDPTHSDNRRVEIRNLGAAGKNKENN